MAAGVDHGVTPERPLWTRRARKQEIGGREAFRAAAVVLNLLLMSAEAAYWWRVA